jgi:hypothetical protein
MSTGNSWFEWRSHQNEQHWVAVASRMLLLAGGTTTSMTQLLFLSAIRTQPCHITILTAKAVVRKTRKRRSDGVAATNLGRVPAGRKKKEPAG